LRKVYVLCEKHRKCVQSVANKTENLKKKIKAVKKEVIMNIHTVKDHQKKAAVMAVKIVAVSVAVAAAAAARGRGKGSGRDSGAVAELWLLWLSCG
jgi:predicted metallo-beta-lactamase superfamily hydrolase